MQCCRRVMMPAAVPRMTQFLNLALCSEVEGLGNSKFGQSRCFTAIPDLADDSSYPAYWNGLLVVSRLTTCHSRPSQPRYLWGELAADGGHHWWQQFCQTRFPLPTSRRAVGRHGADWPNVGFCPFYVFTSMSRRRIAAEIWAHKEVFCC